MNRLERTCDKCGAKDWICVQYAYPHPDRYDGVSEIRCQQCGTRYGRWTDRILEIGESEPPFGDPSPTSGAKEGGGKRMSKIAKMCLRCGQRPAVLPDRDRTTSRSMKHICRECHAARLVGDMRNLLRVTVKQRRESGGK